VNAVVIPRRTLSDVPAAEESILRNTPSLEDANASTNVSLNNNDKDEFSEGVSAERQVKYLGTKRKIHFQEEALYLEKRKFKLMEERQMKSPKPKEDYILLISLLPAIKKTGQHSKIGTQNIISEQRNLQNSNF
jgi:hypothetical protein